MDGMSGYVPTLAQVDELHRKIAPSQAAYDLIHTHCVIVATIAREIVRHQNALFVRRCTLPTDSSGRPDPSQAAASDGITGGEIPPRLLDENLVVIGGLLHDIGTYRVLKHDGSDGEPLKFDGPHYIEHGLLGYQYLLDEGVDESIAQFARNHTGVGLTKDEVIRQGLPLPPADYVPVNLEQEVVMVADKYNSKSVPPKFLTAQSYANKAARFGEANRRAWLDLVDKYGEPDIPALAEQFHQRVV